VLPQEDCPATHHRYPTRAALEHLTELLHLQPDAYMQDWEVELADAARVDDFLTLTSMPTWKTMTVSF